MSTPATTTSTGGTPSPPKPWETGPSADSTAAAAAPLSTYGPHAGGNTPYGPAAAPYPAAASTYGPYGSAYSSSPYGASSLYSSPYGSSPYSSYGSTPYGGSYGGMGGGYGSYGGMGGGYGSYGGMGGYSSYGGMGGMGGMGYGGGYGSMYGGMPPVMPGMEWLGGLHQTSTSIGQISQVLGGNADALQFAVASAAHLVERMGALSVDFFSFLAGTPPLPMVDPRTGQPIVDPRTGQPFPVLSPEQYRKERRVRIFRWAVGLLVLYAGFRFVKYMLRPSKPLDAAMNSAFQDNLQRMHVQQTQTAAWPPGPTAGMPSLGGNSSSGFVSGALRPDLDAAFRKL